MSEPPAAANDEPVLYGEPIIGWRCWHLEAGGTHLLSGTRRVVWPHRQPLRALHLGPNPCGDSPCPPHVPLMRPGCGIYAFKTPADLIYEAIGLRIVGTVYLWGRIIEHEHGFRAQYAYPASFVSSWLTGDELARLAEQYNVPVDEENPVWKSVCRLDALWRNRSTFPLRSDGMNRPRLQRLSSPLGARTLPSIQSESPPTTPTEGT